MLLLVCAWYNILEMLLKVESAFPSQRGVGGVKLSQHSLVGNALVKFFGTGKVRIVVGGF